MSVKELRLPESLVELLGSCETHCVAGCCGLDAFEFTVEGFRQWFLAHPGRKDEIVAQMEGLLRDMEGQSEEEASSGELNAWWKKAEALEFFSRLRSLAEEAS